MDAKIGIPFDGIEVYLDEGMDSHADFRNTDVGSKDIAIIGIAGKFPKAGNVKDLWENICLGKDCIDKIPLQRKKDYEAIKESFLQEVGGKEQADYAESGYLDRIDLFDCDYFSISPKEARLMDPNQRMFLQCCIEAIEDAGYSAARLKGSQTGIFLGYSSDFGMEYKHILNWENAEVADLSIAGNIRSIIAARIAYLLDLHGPSMLIDTACSSSLVSVHLACRSIRNGECDMAIAGGVNVQLKPFDKASTGIGIVSSKYRARTFDKDADGTGLGEGVGAVLLKDLASAVNDRDHIYAVIKGSAVNQDGKTIGITAPNSKAQEELIIKAWRDAKINPETITLIEAHGTATKLGDPVEIDGIKRAFSRYTGKKQFCAIGSIKTNIGHLDNAAGISGLIKCVLALDRKILPPTINFLSPNKEIDFTDSPVYVNDRMRSWDSSEYPRRCGINSFGLSGTNCHIVLEEYAGACESGEMPRKNCYIIVLSAKNEDALNSIISEYYHYLVFNKDVDLNDLCYTANTGRDFLPHRIAVFFSDRKDLMKKLLSIRKTGLRNISVEGAFYGSEEVPPDVDASSTGHEVLQAIRSVMDGDSYPSPAQLRELASRIVRCADIPWQDLYRDGRYRRISLPTYPFQEKRCWIEPKRYEKGLKPFVDRLIANTKDLEIYETRFAVDRHWALAEHIIIDNYVLPGTVYLEMIYSIAQKYITSHKRVVFQDFTFLNPLKVREGEIKSVHIIIRKQKDTIDAEVVSPAENSRDWVVHCKGKAVLEGGQREKKYYKLKEILSETKKLSVSDYKPSDDAPIKTGSHWECMKEIHVTDDKLVAFLELPLRHSHEISMYSMHPSLLDCAVNIPISQIRDGLFLPFSYKKFSLYANVPARFYSILKINHEEGAQIQETVTFDLTLVDENENVIAEIEQYTLKRVHADNFAPGSKHGYGLFHQLVWEEDSYSGGKNAANNIPTVIFSGADDISGKIVDSLRNANIPLIVVEHGNTFEKIDDFNYRIGSNQDDYSRLFKEPMLNSAQRIVHCFSLSNKGQDCFSQIEEQQNKGFLSLFRLTKALVANNVRDVRDIVLVSCFAFQVTNDEYYINPFNSAFYHLGKVVGSEYPNLRCRCIDLDDKTGVEVILNELDSAPDSYISAYRNNKRYIQKITEAAEKLRDKNEVILNEQGCYVITGGTGGLGLTIALSMSAKKPVNLALISRTGFPEESGWRDIIEKGENQKLIDKINTVRRIKENGSSVVFCKADVSCKEQLEAALNEARNKFGKINGVIHAAGVAGDKFIFRKDEEQFIGVIKPKIYGGLNLGQLVYEPLDFFVCFSSVSVLEGTPGQGDYVAANGFLDSLAYCLPRDKNGLAINWAPWMDVGMAYDYGVAGEESTFLPLPSNEAVSAFETALSSGMRQIIIGEVNSREIANKYKNGLIYSLNNILMRYAEKSEPVQAPEIQHNIGENISFGDGMKGASLDNIRDLIRQMWIRLLEVETVGLNDSFTSRGGNSIFAVYLLNELEKYFPGMVGISDIFTYSTINQMAEYLYFKVSKDKGPALETNGGDDEDLIMDQVLNRLASGELDVDEVYELLGED